MILIKIGGGENINIRGILSEVSDMDEQVVIVHGANAAMGRLNVDLGIEPKFLESPSGQQFRYSDQRTMEIFTAAYCGIRNKQIVATAMSLGVQAVGLSGIDAGLWQAERKPVVLAKENGKVKAIKDNYHGKITQINTKLLETLLRSGYLPIITAPAVTAKGEIVNIDNDIAISLMVEHMNISKVISFIEAGGVLENYPDPESRIKRISHKDLGEKLDDFEGRMKKKILGAMQSFENGLEELIIADGREEKPLSGALSGNGTIITKS